MLIVGRDCRPQIGLRVEKVRREVPIESAFDFGFNSLVPPGTFGTIEEAEDEGDVCTVRWDNGELQVCSCGPDTMSDLAVIEFKNLDSAGEYNESESNSYLLSSRPIEHNIKTVSASASTIGLRIYQGQKVDYVVPGGPAHLSNMFDRFSIWFIVK